MGRIEIDENDDVVLTGGFWDNLMKPENAATLSQVSPVTAVIASVTELVLKARKGDKKAKGDLKDLKAQAAAGDPAARKAIAAASVVATATAPHSSFYDAGVAIAGEEQFDACVEEAVDTVGHDPYGWVDVGAVVPGYSWNPLPAPGHWERTPRGKQDVPGPDGGSVAVNKGGGGGIQSGPAAAKLFQQAVNKAAAAAAANGLTASLLKEGWTNTWAKTVTLATGQKVVQHVGLPNSATEAWFYNPKKDSFLYLDKRTKKTQPISKAIFLATFPQFGDDAMQLNASKLAANLPAGRPDYVVNRKQAGPSLNDGLPTASDQYAQNPENFGWEGYSTDGKGNIIGPDGNPWTPTPEEDPYGMGEYDPYGNGYFDPNASAYPDPYGGTIEMNPYAAPYGYDPSSFNTLDPNYDPGYGYGYDANGEVINNASQLVYDEATDSFYSNQQRQVYDEDTGTFVTPQTYNPYDNSYVMGSYKGPDEFLANVDRKPGMALSARALYHRGVGGGAASKGGLLKRIANRLGF